MKDWLKVCQDVDHPFRLILTKSEFFEISNIRDVFFKAFLSRTISVVKSSSGLGDILKNFKNLVVGDIQEHLNFTADKIDKNSLQPLYALLTILDSFPVSYFNPNERYSFQWTFLFMEKSLYQSFRTSGSSIKEVEMVLDSVVLCRKLVLKFMFGGENRLITLNHPDILLWYLKSVEDYQEHTSHFLLLQQFTKEIQKHTLIKLFTRFSTILIKDGLVKPIPYIESIVKFLRSQLKKNQGEFVAVFWESACVYLKMTPQKDSADDDLKKYFLEFANYNQGKFTRMRDGCLEKILDSLLTYYSLHDSTTVSTVLENYISECLKVDGDLNLNSISIILKWSHSLSTKVSNDQLAGWFIQLCQGSDEMQIKDVTLSLVSSCRVQDYKLLVDLHLNQLQLLAEQVVQQPMCEIHLGILFIGRSLVLGQWNQFIDIFSKVIQFSGNVQLLSMVFDMFQLFCH
ncbi:hypothetical protein BC833DRAFT_103127 [Globomyces pollinis-pini]|nr:hypothetical protein BC833DRAFT_103127 [Globomyces pollinis-pini]